jgi:hypothetical protein
MPPPRSKKMSKRLTTSAFVSTLAMVATALFTGVQHGHVETASILTMMGG